MSRRKKISLFLFSILIIGLVLPENMSIPVSGATPNSWNKDTFWYYPWGKSGTHKGLDIFAREGTDVNSATAGIILYQGNISMGGNVVVILGPKWRIHYYAHLKRSTADILSFVSRGEKIGEVGTTGNAKGKSPHLHYSLVTPIPYFWRIDGDHQGWKKMFYLNPSEHFNN